MDEMAELKGEVAQLQTELESAPQSAPPSSLTDQRLALQNKDDQLHQAELAHQDEKSKLLQEMQEMKFSHDSEIVRLKAEISRLQAGKIEVE